MTLDDVYEELLPIVSEVGAQVDVPIESEQFFEELADTFAGSSAEFVEYVRANLRSWFVCLNEEPSWLQEGEWQFANGKPMVFVGEMILPPEKTGLHDDAGFFVFWDRNTGETKTVIQVA
jgi:hypothetical protein